MQRINLGFNEDDPQQNEAYMLLLGHRRKKAEYISRLVIEDENRRSQEDSAEGQNQGLSDSEVRKIVREELGFAVNEIVSKLTEAFSNGEIKVKSTASSQPSSEKKASSEPDAKPKKAAPKEAEEMPTDFFETDDDTMNSLLSSIGFFSE